eukprot:6174212-Pleurochrysis_carterae.AAC.1
MPLRHYDMSTFHSRRPEISVKSSQAERRDFIVIFTFYRRFTTRCSIEHSRGKELEEIFLSAE